MRSMWARVGRGPKLGEGTARTLVSQPCEMSVVVRGTDMLRASQMAGGQWIMEFMVKRQNVSVALVVDDEPDILMLYGMSLQRMNVEAVMVSTLQEALDKLEGGESFGFCITDLRLPDGSGLELVSAIQRIGLNLPVAVVTAYGEVQAAVEALKAGAFDFVTKPISLERLREMVHHGLRLSSSTSAKPGPAVSSPHNPLIGDSPPMCLLRDLIAKVARTQAPVFIHGESGTGKELIARTIHQGGPRANGPFVPVNCGAIPADLIESELFGHRKGSFTGAIADKPGLFRAAHGGTLLLDEVADLPLAVQVRLLRVLQERTVRPVGAVEEVPVDVRVLSASHRNLVELVGKGLFRHDLFYRLNVIQLEVPPLRDHLEDIPALAQHILRSLAEREGTELRTLSPSALSVLQTQDYRGNVRELENLLERAVALSEHVLLTADDLLIANPPQLQGVPAWSATQGADSGPDGLLSTESILKVLDAHRWNRTRAAEALGLTLRQLRYRLAKIENPSAQ